MLFFYQHSFNVKVFCGKCICSERIDQQIQQIGTVYFSIGMFHFVFLSILGNAGGAETRIWMG